MNWLFEAYSNVFNTAMGQGQFPPHHPPRNPAALQSKYPGVVLNGVYSGKLNSGDSVYNVAKGSGSSIIAGRRFDWKKNDIFVVPSWAWHEHANASEREDAVLFSFSDLPSMHALGLYREEAYTENGGHQQLAH